MWEDASFIRSFWNEPWAKNLKLLGHCCSCPLGRATSWSVGHMQSSRCGSEKVPGNCGTMQAGTGLHLLLPILQALQQGHVATGLLAGLETIMKKVGGRPHWAKVGLASQPHPLQPLGSCREPGLPPEGTPLSRFSACPRLGRVCRAGPRKEGLPQTQLPSAFVAQQPSDCNFLLFHFIWFS